MAETTGRSAHRARTWAAGFLILGQLAAVPALAQTQAAGSAGDAATQTAAVPAPLPAMPRQVRVAVVNLKDAAAVGAVPSLQPARLPYRHTFGAERRTIASSRRLDPLAWHADVVLIQGFTSLRETRRLFPARGWKLVMSRQLVEAQSSVRMTDRPPATAIAIRHRRGLKLAGVELKLDARTGTAARVLVGGAPVWVLSAAAGTQEGAAGLDAWLDAKRALGEQTVVGGRLPPTLPRDRGAAVPIGAKDAGKRAAVMPVLIASGERRLIDGAAKSFARFPAANPPVPCPVTSGSADAIVVDQTVADRMKPDTGGWLVVLKRPPPEPDAAQRLSAAQIRSSAQAEPKRTADAAAKPAEPVACVLLLDLGV